MKFFNVWTSLAMLLSTFAMTTSGAPLSDTPTGHILTTKINADGTSEIFYTNTTSLSSRGEGGLVRRGAIMQLNYYSNNECSDYIGNLQYWWAQKQGSGEAGCFNFQWGRSASVAACDAPGGHCMCQFYQQKGFGGGYSTDRQAPWGAYNCRRNSDRYQSMKCYYY